MVTTPPTLARQAAREQRYRPARNPTDYHRASRRGATDHYPLGRSRLALAGFLLLMDLCALSTVRVKVIR